MAVWKMLFVVLKAFSSIKVESGFNHFVQLFTYGKGVVRVFVNMYDWCIWFWIYLIVVFFCNKHFGPNHPYRKIFNRKTHIIFYCCTPNIKAINNGHNKRLLNTTTTSTPNWNCRVKNNCPVEGKCQFKNVIYRGTVTSSSNDVKYYIGYTSRNFKKRLYEHMT